MIRRRVPSVRAIGQIFFNFVRVIGFLLQSTTNAGRPLRGD